MWAIDNQTEFKVDRTFARDPSGAEIWIVAVRGTFSIQDDGAVVSAKEQQEVCLAPVFFGSAGSSSLRYEVDLVRTKPGTDVVVHAHAHAPGRRPMPFVDVGFRVGPVTKGLRIVGDRVWQKKLLGVGASAPKPFIVKPIRYEGAWGGRLPKGEAMHPENPVGVGRSANPGDPIPNCELLGTPIDSPHYSGMPAGFGPIPCNWAPRAKLAGTYDDRWKQHRRPLVPEDFQDSYFRCAPLDQQVDGFLRGGEEVRLLNLSAEGFLSFQLPRITLGFSTRIAGDAVDHRGRLHTVIIEPEERRLIMVWQSALPCHHTLYSLEGTVVFAKKRLFAEPGERPGSDEDPNSEENSEESQDVDAVSDS